MKKTLLSAVAALFAMTAAASVHVTAEVYDDDTGDIYAGTNARIRVSCSHGANQFERETSSTLTVEAEESTMSGSYGNVFALFNGCAAGTDLDREASKWEIVEDTTGIGFAVTASGANAAAIALGWLESQVWGIAKSRDVATGAKVTVRLHVVHARHALTYAPGADGVENVPEGGDFASGVFTTLSSLRPTRTGFTFSHWESGGKAYQPSQPVVFSEDVLMTAVWTTNRYTIAFDANGGTGRMSDLVCDYGRVYALSPVGFSREGHSFDGWKCANTSRRYDDGVIVFNLSDGDGAKVTMSAVWLVRSCSVTFDPCGGSAAEGISGDYGSAYGELPTSVRAGYVFDGWFTAADGGTKVKPDDTLTSVDGQSLYAHWTAKTSALTFNANGGTGEMSKDLEATYDEPMPGPVNLPTKDGHAFQGFFDATSGGTQYYTSTGTSARAWNKDTTAATTLYAQWSVNQYQLTLTKGEHVEALLYSLDDGKTWSETNESCTVVADFGAKLKIYAVPAVGYQTANAESSPLAVTMGVDGVAFSPTATAKTSALTFNANGGTGAMSTGLTATYGAAMPTPINLPTREGHTFLGFYDATADGTQYYTTNGTSATNWDKDITGATTLYAQWSVNQYQLTLAKDEHVETLFYSFDSGTTWMSTNESCMVDVDYGTAVKLYAVPTTGYQTPNDTSERALSATVGVDGVTFSPTATAKASALTFRANGGSGEMSTGLTATYGAAMPTPVNPPSREGHTFLGFYDATTNGTQYYTATGASARDWDKDTTAATTLYAQWNPNQYQLMLTMNEHIETLFYSLDSGTTWIETNACSVAVDYGTAVKLYAVPAVGYQTANNAPATALSVTMGVDGVAFSPTATAKTSALSFSANGGTGEMSTGLTATYGVEMPTPVNLPAWEGHAFLGFYDTTAGGTQYYTATGSSATNWDKDITGAATLYAQWSVSGCTLTLTKNANIAALYYSLDGGTAWASTNASCTVTVDYGTSVKLYAVPAVGYLTDNDSEATALSATMGVDGVTFSPTATAKTSALTFDTNGGTGAMSTDLVAIYGEAMPTPVNLPTWDGNVFMGFFDATSGGTQYYTATGTSVTNWNKNTTEATTLYAQWTADVGEFSAALDIDTLRFYCEDGGWVVTNDSSAVGGSCVATTSSVEVAELKVEVKCVGLLTFNWKLLRPESDPIDEGYSAKLDPENLSVDVPWNVSKMPYKTDWTTDSANLTNGVYRFTFVPGSNLGVHPFSLLLDNVSWTPKE